MRDNQDITPADKARMRDEFAGLALVAMGTWMPLTEPNGKPNGIVASLSNPAMLAARAEWAYAQADAMMAQRNK